MIRRVRNILVSSKWWKIEQLVRKFRQAIDAAYRAHEFRDDLHFKKFPTGCCGDASYLLAEYLLQNNIKIIWVSL